jgi:hypothetical protein
MNTDYAKAEAKKRTDFLRVFLKEINSELGIEAL